MNTPQPFPPEPPSPPEVAPLPGKSNPQEEARYAHSPQKTGDPRNARPPAAARMPAVPKPGTAGITSFTGKRTQPPYTSRTAAAHQPHRPRTAPRTRTTALYAPRTTGKHVPSRDGVAGGSPFHAH